MYPMFEDDVPPEMPDIRHHKGNTFLLKMITRGTDAYFSGNAKEAYAWIHTQKLKGMIYEKFPERAQRGSIFPLGWYSVDFLDKDDAALFKTFWL